MNTYYRLKALTEYPASHEQPFYLTANEVDDPYLVLDNFFDIYDLPGIRQSIKLMLDDALQEPDDAMQNSYVADNMQRLAEAAWLLWQRDQQRDANEDSCNNDDVQPGDTDCTNSKPMRLIDRINIEPLFCLQQVFRQADIRGLQKVVSQWKSLALASSTHYLTGDARADLMAFCRRLQKLVEAAYVYARTAGITAQTGVDLTMPSGFKAELMQKEQVNLLNKKYISNPLCYFKNFFGKHPRLYCRAEVWDIFSCAISGTRKTNNAKQVAWYECLYTIIEAAWHLQGQDLQSANNSG